MIGFLEGKILDKRGSQVTILVNGVGYRVFVPISLIDTLREESLVKVFTYLSVRENALDLYGFSSVSDRSIFELLLTVSGIGPKTALGVLNTASPAQIEKAVVEQNAGFLTKIGGVSKKISEKIVLELKGKMFVTSKENTGSSEDVDVIEALVSLGYSQKQARDAVRDLPENIKTTSEKVKFSLKNVSPNAK